ncbi:stage III sporulation protein AA [Anoxybacter fermentans]|uniref:Stage III sporulation protein AA n=1 Tax=Anoxybacter fermentans TaxID=1323375 RepID=A0A3Q9HQN6_9FIRM|nr:stage III sporulation protein AA [Anoxybacter fermentans]AZR73551.1 stage III sporulation protein AA [Anoxybacter fermentans]
MDRKDFTEEIAKFLPQRLRSYFKLLKDEELDKLQEIRLRVNRPLNLILGDRDLFLGKDGLHTDPFRGEIIKRDDLGQAILFLSNHSIYALKEELRQGFITIPGGHRVGFVGSGIIKAGKIDQIKDFSGINFRITREIKGCANPVIPQLIKASGDIHHTMIVSPPRCGKTTLLRDIIRQLSNGWSGFSGLKVGVVDERSELAGSFQGIPHHDLGVRTDVLDHCPKSTGMYLLIRSMSPQVIATDEIGSAEDVAAIQEAVRAGIRLIVTVHGSNLRELMDRPILKELLTSKIFTRYVLLSNRNGAGTIEGVYDQDLTKIFKVGPAVKERFRYG